METGRFPRAHLVARAREQLLEGGELEVTVRHKVDAAAATACWLRLEHAGEPLPLQPGGVDAGWGRRCTAGRIDGAVAWVRRGVWRREDSVDARELIVSEAEGREAAHEVIGELDLGNRGEAQQGRGCRGLDEDQGRRDGEGQEGREAGESGRWHLVQALAGAHVGGVAVGRCEDLLIGRRVCSAW